MSKWYTFKVRYFDTAPNIDGEISEEYKVYELVNTSIEGVVKDWLHVKAFALKQTNPYNILWILTGWNCNDYEHINKLGPNEEYWSGEKEDALHMDLTNEIERIFFMTKVDNKNDFDAYQLFKERGYLPENFKGTKYDKWAKGMAKQFGWEKKEELSNEKID